MQRRVVAECNGSLFSTVVLSVVSVRKPGIEVHSPALAEPWSDPRRWRYLIGTLSPLMTLVPSQLVAPTGLTIFWWSAPFAIFFALPLVDLISGEDRGNPPERAYRDLADDPFYRWCTYAFIPVQLLVLFVAGFLWSSPELSVLDRLGLATSIGFAGGVAINVAHELGHRLPHERLLAWIALAQSGYGHFNIEHNRGHHVRVATPEDNASARYGESFWAFFPRSSFGGFRSSCRIERARLARQGRPFVCTDNVILQGWAFSAVLLIALVAPLWRRVMHPRLLAFYGGDLTRVNLAPWLRGQRVH